jgi:hypothetical protein
MNCVITIFVRIFSLKNTSSTTLAVNYRNRRPAIQGLLSEMWSPVVRLAESHEYYAQVQCQMFVTDAKLCGKNKHCIK